MRVFESRRQDQVRGRVKQGHFQQGFIDQGRFIREGIGQASGDRGGGMDRGRRVGPLAERVAGPRLTAAAPLACLFPTSDLRHGLTTPAHLILGQVIQSSLSFSFKFFIVHFSVFFFASCLPLTNMCCASISSSPSRCCCDCQCACLSRVGAGAVSRAHGRRPRKRPAHSRHAATVLPGESFSHHTLSNLSQCPPSSLPFHINIVQSIDGEKKYVSLKKKNMKRFLKLISLPLIFV